MPGKPSATYARRPAVAGGQTVSEYSTSVVSFRPRRIRSGSGDGRPSGAIHTDSLASFRLAQSGQRGMSSAPRKRAQREDFLFRDPRPLPVSLPRATTESNPRRQAGHIRSTPFHTIANQWLPPPRKYWGCSSRTGAQPYRQFVTGCHRGLDPSFRLTSPLRLLIRKNSLFVRTVFQQRKPQTSTKLPTTEPIHSSRSTRTARNPQSAASIPVVSSSSRVVNRGQCQRRRSVWSLLWLIAHSLPGWPTRRATSQRCRSGAAGLSGCSSLTAYLRVTLLCGPNRIACSRVLSDARGSRRGRPRCARRLPVVLRRNQSLLGGNRRACKAARDAVS